LQVPKNPAVDLSIRVFDLAQFAIAGNNHSDFAFSVNDGLTGNTFGQSLRRRRRDPTNEDDSSRRQDRPFMALLLSVPSLPARRR
jgi:hypothetical protein